MVLMMLMGLVLIGLGFPFKDGAHIGLAVTGLAFAIICGRVVYSDIRKATAAWKN
jgi:hypothetical protein